MRKGRGFLLVLALVAGRPLAAGLPPVPVPAENPITEPKRVLGKILFWDEQLSSDGSVACGTCHRFDPAVLAERGVPGSTAPQNWHTGTSGGFSCPQVWHPTSIAPSGPAPTTNGCDLHRR